MKAVKILLLTILVAILLASAVSGGEYTYSSDDYGEDAVLGKWDKLVESLPEDIRDDLGIYNLSSAPSAVAEKTGARYWIKIAWRELCEAASEYMPDVLTLISLILLTAIAKASLPQLSQGIADAFTLVSDIVIAIPLMSATYRALSISQAYLTNITALMDILSPIMKMLCLAEGAISEASAASNSVMTAVTVIGNLNTCLVSPIVSVLFSLSALTVVCGDGSLGGFTESLRKLVMRIWQILTLFFSFMIGTQSVIAKSADTLASRTARFAIGSMIPVAGGIIAEAYNTLKEGVAYLRSAAGIGGIILILLILLYGIVPLLFYKAAFGIASYAAGMLKLDNQSKLLENIKGIIDLMMAIVLYTSMMLVFALVLFTKSRGG